MPGDECVSSTVPSPLTSAKPSALPLAPAAPRGPRRPFRLVLAALVSLFAGIVFLWMSLPRIVLFLMSAEVIRPAAVAVPARAATSARIATTMAGDGPRPRSGLNLIRSSFHQRRSISRPGAAGLAEAAIWGASAIAIGDPNGSFSRARFARAQREER